MKNSLQELMRSGRRHQFTPVVTKYATALLILSLSGMGCASLKYSPSERAYIDRQIDKMRENDEVAREAISELIAMGPVVYEPLARELLHGDRNGVCTSQNWALNALSEINDKRVILLFGRLAMSDDIEVIDRYYGAMLSYLEKIVGKDWAHTDSYEKLKRWFDNNQNNITWDDTEKRFIKSENAESKRVTH